MGERKGGVIYKSFIDAVRQMDDATQLEALNAYFDYLFDGDQYAGDSPVVKAIMLMAYPSIDNANARYENGKKGGRPKTEQNQTETKNNLTITKTKPNETKNNLTITKTKPNETKPKPNVTYQKEVEVEVEEEVEEEVEVDKKEKEKEKRPVRHRHGEYNHILLTEAEYKKLLDDYGEDRTKKAIRKVDEYCERTGKTYKNYNLVLRNWGFEAPPGTQAVRKLEEAWIHEL